MTLEMIIVKLIGLFLLKIDSSFSANFVVTALRRMPTSLLISIRPFNSYSWLVFSFVIFTLDKHVSYALRSFFTHSPYSTDFQLLLTAYLEVMQISRP